MSLQKEIDDKRKEIRTDAYSMSIGEWISMYESDPPEIDIHPEFQRFYRWTEEQKTRFIESILLGIPIPTIYVSQRDDGVWDVIDGLQRLSTIYEFVGILKGPDGEILPPLVLGGTNYLPSLKGVVWNADNYDEYKNNSLTQSRSIGKLEQEVKSLTIPQRLLIKRAKIPASIILKESDEGSKYDLFQRLNTGGTGLTPQEARNCILISINQPLYERLRNLSKDENFVNCVRLNENLVEEQYDMELVLRFLVFRNLPEENLKSIDDLNTFLTDMMERIARDQDFDIEQEEKYFRETFALLAVTCKENSFRRYDLAKGRFVRGFLVSAFEAVALGIGYNINLINKDVVDVEKMIQGMWIKQEFTKNIGSGVNASSRISKVIPLCRTWFRP